MHRTGSSERASTASIREARPDRLLEPPGEPRRDQSARSVRSSAKKSRRNAWWVGAVLLGIAVFAVPLLTGALFQGQGIVIGPGVVFRPSQAFADISFATQQTFQNAVVVRPSGVIFDGVAFFVEKVPRQLPRANVTITTWSPGAGHGSAAISLVASSEANSTLWFNITGLRADAYYDIRVDAVQRAFSSTLGNVSFSWSSGSPYSLDVVAYIDTGPPVAVIAGRQTATVGEVLTFDGAASFDDNGVVRYQWDFGDGGLAEGPTVQHAYAADGQYSVTLTVWDAVGKSNSTAMSVEVGPPPPTIDGIPPVPIADLRTVEVGVEYVVLEWTAPGDDADVGQASSYDVRSTRLTPLNETNFLDGAVVPSGLPQAAGALERLNVTGLTADTLYWFALRTSDEVPNWSPISNVVEALTLFNATAPPSGPPAVGGVWYDPSEAQLDVVFSKSMNRTTVEASLVISPEVPYDVAWQNDAHLTISFESLAEEGSTYLLTIEDDAADQHGIPIVSSFTFQFTGIPTAEAIQVSAELPFHVVLPMLVGVAGLLAGLLLVSARLYRSERKIHTLQDIAMVQARRIKDLVRSQTRVQTIQDFATMQAKRLRDLGGRLRPRSGRRQ